MDVGLKLEVKSSSKSNNKSVYKQLVGILVYCTAMRSYLSFAANYISKFMTAPKDEHWTTANRVLRYVQGTLENGIMYGKGEDFYVLDYKDSNWTRLVDDRKSTIRYVL